VWTSQAHETLAAQETTMRTKRWRFEANEILAAITQPERRVFESLVDGDIIVHTDGEPYRGGVVYRVEFNSPGEFADEFHAEVMPAD